MDAPKPRETHRTFSEPVLQMVATASDEQLAWIVGPDRHYYSKEAIEAATRELEARRENADEDDEGSSFNAAAFVFGPMWYFYHGMIGRGVLIFAVLLGAILGLDPVADAIGIPSVLWIFIVVASVGGYCSRFASRDLTESRIQARLTARKPVQRRGHRPDNDDGLVEVVTVGCRMAAEQAKTFLANEGIRSFVEVVGAHEDQSQASPDRSSSPTVVKVSKKELRRARELLAVLFAETGRDPSSICDDLP